VAGSQTEVATGKILVAGLLAGRTLSRVAMVRHSLCVVTSRRLPAQLTTSRGLGCLLQSTGNSFYCLLASTADVSSQDTGITLPTVTGSGTLVVVAAEGSTTHLLTRWTVAITALPLALVTSTLPHIRALHITQVFGAARNFFLLPTTSTHLHCHLHALSTGTIVTRSRTFMAATK
jgi:hypothetical protein